MTLTNGNEITIKEVEVTKLDLKSGQLLVVKAPIPSGMPQDWVAQRLEAVRRVFLDLLPAGVNILVTDDEVELTVVDAEQVAKDDDGKPWPMANPWLGEGGDDSIVEGND